MITTQEFVEGTWEEIALLSNKFNGHRLRVTILPDADDKDKSDRLRALNDWFSLPRPAGPANLDDSRAGIYGEEPDRG